MDQPAVPLEISVTEANALAQAQPQQVLIVDVREPDELAICQIAGAQAIPMRQVPARLAELPRDRHLLVLCHHGSRSRAVTQFLRAQGYAKVTNIAGGIDAWAEEVDPTLAQY
jgi:adenylyltransferase/sulfurtransferase